MLEDRITPNAYLVNVLGDAGATAAGVASSDNNPLHGDLRYVLNKAITDGQADTITFDSTVFNTAQTITLNAKLDTDPTSVKVFSQTAFVLGGSANMTIDGPSAGVTIDGGGKVRLFAMTANASLTLNDLTLTGGLSTGGEGVTGGGGGLGAGGAVFDDGGSFSAVGCTFTNDKAKGGGISLGSSGGGGGLGGGNGTAANGNGNDGGGANGGGVSANGGFGGGGGYRGFGGFGGGGGTNGAGGFGGGGGKSGAGGFGGGSGATRSNYGGGGGAGLGGGVFSNGGTLVLYNDTFTADTAAGGGGSGYGGAVFVRNGSLTATFDTFGGNTADGGTDVYVLSDSASGSGFTGGTATAVLVNDILGQDGATTVSDFYANAINGAAAPILTGSKTT